MGLYATTKISSTHLSNYVSRNEFRSTRNPYPSTMLRLRNKFKYQPLKKAVPGQCVPILAMKKIFSCILQLVINLTNKKLKHDM